jgi:hypothetical protein
MEIVSEWDLAQREPRQQLTFLTIKKTVPGWYGIVPFQSRELRWDIEYCFSLPSWRFYRRIDPVWHGDKSSSSLLGSLAR